MKNKISLNDKNFRVFCWYNYLPLVIFINSCIVYYFFVFAIWGNYTKILFTILFFLILNFYYSFRIKVFDFKDDFIEFKSLFNLFFGNKFFKVNILNWEQIDKIILDYNSPNYGELNKGIIFINKNKFSHPSGATVGSVTDGTLA